MARVVGLVSFSLMGLRHFPLRVERFPRRQYRLCCHRLPSSAALSPTSLQDPEPWHISITEFFVLSWSVCWLEIIFLTFHERSWAMQFLIISAKAKVPYVASALLTPLATERTSAWSTASHCQILHVRTQDLPKIMEIPCGFNLYDSQGNVLYYFYVEGSHLKSRETFLDSIYQPTRWGDNRYLHNGVECLRGQFKLMTFKVKFS